MSPSAYLSAHRPRYVAAGRVLSALRSKGVSFDEVRAVLTASPAWEFRKIPHDVTLRYVLEQRTQPKLGDPHFAYPYLSERKADILVDVLEPIVDSLE